MNPYGQQGYPPQQQGYPQQQPPQGYPQQQQQGYPQQGGYQQQQQQPYPPPQQGYGYPPPQNPCESLFRAVDRDRSGRIDGTELKNALSQGGLEFNIDTAHRMINMFDRTGDGKIDMGEFQQLHAWVMQMAQAFQQVDTSRNGLLDGQEVRRALATSGYRLAEPTFQLLMRKVDRERRGELALSGYLDLCMILGHTRNVFGFYDKQRAGQVTFDFDGFLTASLSLRI
eukprot:PhM_4_TR16495/c0_g1_i1/m.21367